MAIPSETQRSSPMTRLRELNSNLPRLDWVTVSRNGAQHRLPFWFRKGTNGPALLFVHGLGGAKENFYAAFQSAALAHCDLLAFDLPGTGLAEFDDATRPDVSTLADLTHLLLKELLPRDVFIVAASMGGLIALLLGRRYGIKEMRGFISIEGNLAPEDCIFSRRVAAHSFDELSATLFDQIQTELRSSNYAGDRMIAHNLALNTDIRAYYAYSFETVRESDSGRLLDEYLNLPVPKLFLYGEANKTLSYLPALRASNVKVCEIARSAHFLFYDDPVATFEEIGRFVNE
jgi:pimeloyl-ACP methyl ester carboxylesterase